MKLFFEKFLLIFQGKRLILLSIFLTFIITAIGLLAVGYLFKTKYPKLASYVPLAQNEVLKNTNKISKDQNLSQENLLVYERCINGEHNPDFCILYTAELFKPYTEKEVYRYEFARKDEDEYNTPNRLHLLGVTKNSLVYSAQAKDMNEIGLIDLSNGIKAVVNSSVSSLTPYGDWGDVYVDSANSKIYYSTCDEKYNCNLLQYNILTKKEIVKSSFSQSTRARVFYADIDKAYLDVEEPGMPRDVEWNKTLNLKDSTLSNISSPRVKAAFSYDGKRVAYVQTENLSDEWYIKRLIISDIDGKNEIELYKSPNSRSTMTGPNNDPIVDIQDVQISPSGSSVLAKVVDTSEKNPSTHFYQWNMGISSNPDFKPNKGILLSPTGKTPMQLEFNDPTGINKYNYLSLKSLNYRIKDDSPFNSNYKSDIVAFTVKTGETDIGALARVQGGRIIGRFGYITYLTGLDLQNARPVILGADEFILIP